MRRLRRDWDKSRNFPEVKQMGEVSVCVVGDERADFVCFFSPLLSCPQYNTGKSLDLRASKAITGRLCGLRAQDAGQSDE